MTHQMREIEGFEGYYIDTNGSVWSRRSNNGGLREMRKLKPQKSGGGHFQVKLYKKKKPYLKTVHRLVLKAFVGECPQNMEGCHNNGNVYDNNLKNLRWDTKRENQMDAIRHGTHVCFKGEDHHNAKLNKFQVQRIRLLKEITPAITGSKIGNVFGLNRNTANKILARKSWAHI